MGSIQTYKNGQRKGYFKIWESYIVGRESKTCIFDFYIFQERQKTE